MQWLRMRVRCARLLSFCSVRATDPCLTSRDSPGSKASSTGPIRTPSTMMRRRTRREEPSESAERSILDLTRRRMTRRM